MEETALSLKEEVKQLEAYLEHFASEYESFRESVLKFFQKESLFQVSTFEVSVVLTSRIGQTAVRSYTGAQVELHNYILGIRPTSFDLSEEGYGTLLGISFENSASVAPWAGTDWVVFHPEHGWLVQKGEQNGLDSMRNYCKWEGSEIEELIREVFIEAPRNRKSTERMHEGKIIPPDRPRTQESRGLRGR